MGSCLSAVFGKGSKGETNVLETTTNAATTCKLGLKSNNITAGLNRDTNTYSLSGKGSAIGSCALDCDTAFWEVHVGKNPAGLKIGVKRFNPKKPSSLDGELDGSGEGDSPSWCLSGVDLKEGDVIGICWDQTDLPMLSFLVNGEMNMSSSITRIRPANDIYPAVSIDSGSTCDLVFDGNHFKKAPQNSKFTMIVCASSLI
mmetsp:Transcript_16923/g.25522  ORF Transcript_16923/g.25522 Transcript_16923/m.25522 type:complete len:201 (+) Transcript_16923:132-734(+)